MLIKCLDNTNLRMNAYVMGDRLYIQNSLDR